MLREIAGLLYEKLEVQLILPRKEGISVRYPEQLFESAVSQIPSYAHKHIRKVTITVSRAEDASNPCRDNDKRQWRTAIALYADLIHSRLSGVGDLRISIGKNVSNATFDSDPFATLAELPQLRSVRIGSGNVPGAARRRTGEEDLVVAAMKTRAEALGKELYWL